MATERNLTHTPQIAWLVFSAGIMFSLILAKKDKGLALLFGIVMISFLDTILFGRAPKVQLFEGMFIAFSAALVYYMTSQFRLTESTLKYFLIPSLLNIIFVFIQRFAPDVVPLASKEVCGLLGNAGLTATFLGMTTPIFIRYFKIGLPFLLTAIMFCKGYVGLLAFLVCCLFALRGNKKEFLALLITALCAFAWICFNHQGQVMLRLSMMAGTLDGIFYHWFRGWGFGSFASVMGRVPTEESIYLGTAFNTKNFIMNHPANEFLFGWWNFGLVFFVGSIACVWNTLTHYKSEKAMSFSILLAGLVVMMFFFFTPPTLFMMAMALGIYQNTNGGNYGIS